MQTKAAIFNALKKEMQLNNGVKSTTPLAPINGVPAAFSTIFPQNSFPTTAVHEFLIQDTEQLAASTSFTAALISSYIAKPCTIVWLGLEHQIFPNGLLKYNLQPEHIIFISPKKIKDLQWCTEEALRCNGIGAVVATLPGIDFTYSRRLQLAVEKSNTTGFILNTKGKVSANNAFVTRWNITHRPSINLTNMPGIGSTHWHADLLKIRNGRPSTHLVQWQQHKLHLEEHTTKDKTYPTTETILQYG